jgi:hypothetical protein
MKTALPLSRRFGAAMLFACALEPLPAEAQERLRLQLGEVAFTARVSASAQGALIDRPGGGDSSDGNLDASLRLNAEWISDTGWISGARFEIETEERESEELQRDEAYVYIGNDYGRIEIGEQDGPADVMALHAPVIGLGQVRGDFSRYAGSSALLSAFDTSDTFKVIVLTAPFGGLRAGVSWSPEFNRNSSAVNPRDRTLVDDVFEFGAQYLAPFGDWVVGASAGYVTGKADPITTRGDWDSWAIGSEARRGPLTIGVGYVRRGESNSRTVDLNEWEVNAGVAWSEDVWGVALSAATTQSRTRDNNLVGVGGYYVINDFITLRADAVYFRETFPGRAGRDGGVLLTEIEFRY